MMMHPHLFMDQPNCLKCGLIWEDENYGNNTCPVSTADYEASVLAEINSHRRKQESLVYKANGVISFLNHFIQYPYRDEDRGFNVSLAKAKNLISEIERDLEEPEQE